MLTAFNIAPFWYPRIAGEHRQSMKIPQNQHRADPCLADERQLPSNRRVMRSTGPWRTLITQLHPRIRAGGAIATAPILLLICNSWRFSSSFIPLHDSLQIYQVFHFAYNSVFYSGKLPEWMPYDEYGMPIDFYRLACLTPPDYLTIYAGGLLHIHNALLMFKIAMTLEELIFVFGIYLLGRHLLRNGAAVLFLCISAAIIPDYTYQAWWNFRIYYLFPLVILYLSCFFEYRRGRFLWIAGVAFVASMIGNLPYFAPVYIFLIFVLALVYGFRCGVPWRAVFSRKYLDLVWFFAFVVFSAGYLYAVLHSLDGMVQSDVVGRDPVTHRVSLEQFLTYGGHPSLAQMVQMSVVGSPVYGHWTSHFDQSVYIGLIPLLLIPWSIATVRSIGFIAIMCVAALLLWSSAGGVMSRIVYFFPTMSLFRHLGVLYPLAKVPLLLAAAYGVQSLAECGRLRHAIFGVVLLLIAADLAALGAGPGTHLFLGLRIAMFVVSAFSVLAFSAHGAPPGHQVSDMRLRGLGPALVIVQTFDLILFNFSVRAACPIPDASKVALASMVSPQVYPEQRHQFAPTVSGRAKEQIEYWNMAHNGESYPTVCDWMQYAQSPQLYFTPIAPEGVDMFRKVMHDRVQSNDSSSITLEYARIVGYLSPRVRLLEAVDFANDGFQIVQDLETLPSIDERVVLPRAESNESSVSATSADAGRVEVTSFSSDRVEMETNVMASGGAWLVYADAYDPDWRAEVDGSEVQIRPAYIAFKAIHVPSGSHDVIFKFRHDTITIGRLIASASVLLCVAFLFELCRQLQSARNRAIS